MATRYPKALKWFRWFTPFTWTRLCGKIPKCSIPIVFSIRTRAKWLNLNISFRSASDGGSVLATSLPKLSFFYSFQRFCTRSNWRCHPVPQCRTWGDRPESPFHRNLSRYVEGIWKYLFFFFFLKNYKSLNSFLIFLKICAEGRDIQKVDDSTRESTEPLLNCPGQWNFKKKQKHKKCVGFFFLKDSKIILLLLYIF